MYIKVQHLGFVFIALMLFATSASQVYATIDAADDNNISNETIRKVSENIYAFQFKYCSTTYNQGALGVIVSSDTEKIPLQIDLDIQIGECHQYGTQIRAFSEKSLDTSVFYEKDMKKLFKNFNEKKMNLEKDLVYLEQKLLRLENPEIDEENSEKIIQVKTRIELIEDVIESYRQGLSTLTAFYNLT